MCRMLALKYNSLSLTRDLTQALYNHRKPPYVSLAEADTLMVAHIERYWAPSIPMMTC